MKNAINREARGFLDFLRAKVGGVGPQTFQTDIRPVVDIEPYISGPILLGQESSTTASGSGTLEIAVPANETWKIYFMSAALVDTIGAAGTFGHAKLSIADITNGASSGGLKTIDVGSMQIGSGAETASTGQEDSVVYNPNGKLLVPPAAKLRTTLNGSSGTVTIKLSVLYVPLNI